MGTLGDWAFVAFVATFWGAFFLPLRGLMSSRKFSLKEVWAKANFIPSFFDGWFIGILIAFHWRAFHWPLILVTVAAFIVAGLATSRKLNPRPIR